jgi:hypothetical protein
LWAFRQLVIVYRRVSSFSAAESMLSHIGYAFVGGAVIPPPFSKSYHFSRHKNHYIEGKLTACFAWLGWFLQQAIINFDISDCIVEITSDRGFLAAF